MATITVAMETMGNSFHGHQNPKADNTYDLGQEGLLWRTLFTENISIDGEIIPVNKITYIGSPNGDPLLKSGGNMTGDINWTTTGQGIKWGMNTDGAGIRFNNTGDQDTNSCLEFYTFDNEEEFFRWSHRKIGTQEHTTWMELKKDGLFVQGEKVFSGSSLPTAAQLDAIGPRGNWRTNGGQDLLVHDKRALVGFTNGELHLGYGNDFSTIKCGNGHTIYHTGNLNNTTSLSLKALSLANAEITMGGRVLSIQYAEPSNPANGTIWIK